MNSSTENISSVLTKLRHEKGQTQDQVAKALGMHKTTYWATEKGNRGLTINQLTQIARYYGKLPTTVLEMIQQTPAELSQVKKLQLQLDSTQKELAYSRSQLEEQLRKTNA